jgi:hypothetical protein
VAFGLADFLSGDSEFTKVLAEAGHLPAGRPGYGIDILARSLADGKRIEPAVERFVDAVQKSIEQGTAYPQLASWPTAVENLQVMEALQMVWRRMGEGDPNALKRAAKDAESLINSHINWWYAFLNGIAEAKWTLAGVLCASVLMVAYQVRRRAQSHQRVSLLLYLYRAHRHDAAKFLGDNFYTLAVEAEQHCWPSVELIRRVNELSLHFKNKLVPHIERIAENQIKEMANARSELRLDQVVDLAYDGARYIYQAKQMEPPPDIRYSGGVLDGWLLSKLPYATVVVLEEWFLNSIKSFVAHQIENPVIAAELDGRSLVISSSGELDERERRILQQQPDALVPSSSRQGLSLIRNIVFYAYGTRVSSANVTTARGPEVILRIPFGSAVRAL